MAALKFHIVQKIHHGPKSEGKYYAFKDFILDLIQKMTDPTRREHENYSGNDLSLASTSTAATPWKGEWRPAADPANRLHGGLEIHKMAHVLPNWKNKCATMKNVE